MNYFLVDAEFTGLNTEQDHILEIAYMILDDSFNVLLEKKFLIETSKDILLLMNDYVKDMHSKSGLLDSLKKASLNYYQVEKAILYDLKQHSIQKEIYFLGNSIYMDMLFFKKHMPKIVDWMHYRLVDVSSLKVLIQNWYKDDPYAYFKKKEAHQASLDIQETLNELLYYKEHFFK